MKLLKHVPLWKWIVIVLLVIGMPLLFSFSRNYQLQQAIQTINTQPTPQNEAPQKLHKQAVQAKQ